MDDMPYIRNVRSITHLASELKKIVDDYWQGKVSEITLKQYVHYAAENSKLLADNGKRINVTVEMKIGKKRTAVVMKMLENYQLKLL